MRLLLLASLAVQSPDTTLHTAVLRALAAAPIEAFDSARGATKVLTALELDIEGDGRPEVAAAIIPAFRQTPTILFFRRVTADSLERLPEGLAPGRFIHPARSAGDSHVLRVGMDFSPETHGAAFDTLAMIRTAMANKLSIVSYRGFFHADMRDGRPFFIRLTHSALPTSDTNTCQDLAFPPIISLKYGRLGEGSESRYLVAHTDQMLTIYRLTGVTTDGWLTREVWERPLGPGQELSEGPRAGLLSIRERGETRAIPVPQ